MKKESFEVIVVGAGHAGIEAALAASRMGYKVLLMSLHLDTIGLMSCNPAIGGVGKAQLVREIDALGGQMARATDATAISFHLLNTSRGPAVQSSRAQTDRQRYRLYMKQVIEDQANITLKQAEVTEVLTRARQVQGIRTSLGEEFAARAVILTLGTFLNGLIHIGLDHFPGGRLGEPAAVELLFCLRALGFKTMRFKTGTCPRLDRRSLNLDALTVQEPDSPAQPFSFSGEKVAYPQVPCYITYTNPRTHRIIRDNLDRSPLYTGRIKATGVRYCPSIEDKVVRFSERNRHQVFLEPEGLDTHEVYPNGVSTSLPIDVQVRMLRSIEGLEKVQLIRPGYGIEHEVVDSTQLYPDLQTKRIQGLFLAGQINGTTGYEEAAAQGLMAGINAGLFIKGKRPLILARNEAYIGVLIDDLVTKGTNEPYRMFTSRVEYRLLLRQDNADLRLRHYGYRVGLVSKEEYEQTEGKDAAFKKAQKALKATIVKPQEEINQKLESWHTRPLAKPQSLEALLKRPQISLAQLVSLFPLEIPLSSEVARQLETEVKYGGFIQRQILQAARLRKLERVKIPLSLDFNRIPGLSREVQEKLKSIRPLTLGQAGRISGVTPAALSILLVYLEKLRKNGGFGKRQSLRETKGSCL